MENWVILLSGILVAVLGFILILADILPAFLVVPAMIIYALYIIRMDR